MNYLKQDFITNRKPAVIAGIFAIMFGLLIIYFLGQPSQPLLKSDLTEISGRLDYFEPTQGRFDNTIHLKDGGKYFVCSFINRFNSKDFACNVKKGDNVTLYCEMVNTYIGNAYVVEANGIQYLTLTDSNKDIASNDLIGLIVGWAFIGMGVISAIIGVIGCIISSRV